MGFVCKTFESVNCYIINFSLELASFICREIKFVVYKSYDIWGHVRNGGNKYTGTSHFVSLVRVFTSANARRIPYSSSTRLGSRKKSFAFLWFPMETARARVYKKTPFRTKPIFGFFDLMCF